MFTLIFDNQAWILRFSSIHYYKESLSKDSLKTRMIILS